MCDESPTKESQKIVGMKRTYLEMDFETNSSNGCLEARSSSGSNSPNNMCLNCSSSCASSSSSGSCSGSSFIPNSSPDTTWKTMYEDEHTKNTMLNLQLCFVQSECVRLLNLQSDMASSIATLQNSLTSWIEDVGSDNDPSDSEGDNETDDQQDITSDDMSDSGTDGEDQAPKRTRNPVIIHKQPKTNSCVTITR